MTTQTDKKFEAYREFTSVQGNGNDGFSTLALAKEYSRLRIAWWGSNLVSTGITERNGRFYPGFNVWD